MLARFLAARLLQVVPTFLGITLLTFVIALGAPGDPLQLDPEQAVGSAQAIEQFREAKGLNRPVWVQYGEWLGRVVRLDFGTSLHDHRPVRVKLAEALPPTLALSGLALLLAWVVAVPLGVRAASQPQRRFSRLALQVLDVAYALPSYWVGVLLLLLLATRRGVEWLPLQGLGPEGAGVGTKLWHLVLPVLCLAYPTLAVAARQVSAAMREVLAHDFIRAARARGLSEARVVWRHGLRNAAVPLVNVLGFGLPHLVGGSVVLEQVFGIPGMGRLAFEAIGQRDYPTVMGCCVLVAVATMLAMVVVDLIALGLDPRLRSPRSVR